MNLPERSSCNAAASLTGTVREASRSLDRDNHWRRQHRKKQPGAATCTASRRIKVKPPSNDRVCTHYVQASITEPNIPQRMEPLFDAKEGALQFAMFLYASLKSSQQLRTSLITAFLDTV